MIEVKIPKDVRRFETKIVGPLTARQLVCGVLGIAAVLAVTFTVCLFTPSIVDKVIQAFAAVPFAIVMFAKPYGLPFEKFFVIFLYSYVFSPSSRKYVSKNRYSEIEKKIEVEKKNAKKNAKKERKVKKGEKRKGKENQNACLEGR